MEASGIFWIKPNDVEGNPMSMVLACAGGASSPGLREAFAPRASPHIQYKRCRLRTDNDLRIKTRGPLPSGQSGPSPELAAELGQAPLLLSARRTEQKRQDGERLWKLELRQGDRLLASWEAVSGSASSQFLDRQWSPGNGAPLPAGTYSLGLPEAWGSDIWFSLTPRFKTTRIGLGIHGCNPGTGCVCLPERASLEALAKWVSTSQIQTLRVLN